LRSSHQFENGIIHFPLSLSLPQGSGKSNSIHIIIATLACFPPFTLEGEGTKGEKGRGGLKMEKEHGESPLVELPIPAFQR